MKLTRNRLTRFLPATRLPLLTVLILASLLVGLGAWAAVETKLPIFSLRTPTAALRPVPPTIAAPMITATKTATLAADVNGNGSVNPGDTLMYSVTVTNAGTDATGVSFTDVLNGNLTLIGSATASPIAQNDSYTSIGNVGITVSAGSGVLANDINPQGSGTLSITAVPSGTSTQGGSFVLAANGSFTYNPPVGFEGADSFTYTLNHTNGKMDTGTVNITVSGMIWFINNNAGACSSGCVGTLQKPFTSLAAFNTANGLAGGVNPDNNDNIFVYESSTQYTGAVTLRTGQKLIGQDATATLASIAGLTVQSYTNTLPAMNTSAPTTNLGSTATLNTNATVRGLSINSTTSTGMNDPVAAITGVNVSEVIVATTTGTAVSLSSTGGSLSFTSISANGGTNGIVLNNTTANLTVTGDGTGHANGSGGTIQNITGGVIGNAPVYLLTSSGTISLNSMNMAITINAFSGMLVDNNAGGAITVNVTGCTFTGVQAGNSVQNKALLQFEAGNTGAGAANVTANVQNSFFFDNRTYGVFATAAGDSTMNVTLNQSGFGTEVNTGAPVNNPGTTITNPPPFSVGITNGSNAKVDYAVSNNTFWGGDGLKGALYAVTISGASTVGTSHLNGKFTGNKIGKAGILSSGCANNCAGLGLLPGLAGAFNATVKDNDIRQVNSFGINYTNSVGAGATFSSSLHIKNNTLAEPDTTGSPLLQRAIVVSPGNSGGANTTVCAEIGGPGAGEPNIISGAWQASNFIRVTNNNNSMALTLPGLSPASGATTAQLNTFVASNNGGASCNSAVGTAGINGGAACVPAAIALMIHADEQKAVPQQGGSRNASLTARLQQWLRPVFSAFASPVSNFNISSLTNWVTPSVSAAERTPALTRFAAVTSPAVFAGETVVINGGGSGFLLPAGKSVTIMFNAQIGNSFTGNAITNQANVMAAGGINVNSNNLSTPVIQAPGIVKAFSPANIALSGTNQTTATLTLTLTNPNTAQQLTNVAFSDPLPSGLVVDTTPTATTTGCGSPTFNPAANATSLNFSSGTINVGTPCVVSVKVKGTTAGAKMNTATGATSTQANTGANSNTATLNVLTAPSFTKNFGASSVAVGGTTSLTFNLTNNDATFGLTSVSFTDMLPSGLTVAGTPNVTGSCGSGTITAAANAGSISLAGASLAASGTCTFSVNVTGTTAGTKNNSVALASIETGTNTTPATSTLNVFGPPTISKSFTPNSIVTGQTSTLNIVVGNPASNPNNLTSITFTDTLPAGISAPNSSTSLCGGTVAVSSNVVMLTGGSIAPNTTCTIPITVTGVAASGAAYTNTISSVTSSNGGTNNTAATAMITVNKASTTASITGVALTTATVVGEAYTVSAAVTVTAPGSATPTAPGGTITISDGSQTCTITLPAISCSLTSTSLGAPKNITATYNGDSNFNASPASTAALHSVNKANTTTTISNAATLASTPSVIGQAYAVNWSVTVNAPGALGAALTGNVTVSDGSQTCTAAVGAGTCNLTSTTPGAKTITATYAGDTNYIGSSGTASHTVNCLTSLTVNNLGDGADATPGNGICETATGNGTCTLRAAIQEANALSACSPFTITITATGTITLGSALPDLNHPNLTINGPGANLLTVSGNNAVRVFVINSGKIITLAGLTITNGMVTDASPSGPLGGGIYNSGTLTVVSSTLSGNSASGSNSNGRGGGIFNNAGTVNMTNSTLSGKTASSSSGGGFGGGILNNGGTVNVTNSTLSGNTASGSINSSGFGGGICNIVGTLNVVSSTLSGNTASVGGFGGGISNSGNSGVTANVKNTIIAGNTVAGTSTQGPDVQGSFASQGYNLIGNNANSIGFTATGDQVNVNPMLGPLANNGGPTQTLALLPGSPAIDKGAAANIAGTATPITTDQRGVTRPVDDASIPPATSGNDSDIGAFELNAPEIAVVETGVGNIADGGSFSFGTTIVGNSVTKTFTITNSGTTPLTLANLSVPAGFNIAANFGSTTVASGGTTTFQITMTAAAVSTPSGTLTFDNNDADENPFNFTISGTVMPCPAITLSPTTLSNAVFGESYSATISATGGTGPYTFAVTGGVLPSGLMLMSNGSLTGITNAVNTFNFTITATDTNTGCVGQRAYTIIVNKANTTLTSITDAPDPSVTGQAYTVGFTLNVTSPGAGTPTGTVSVSDGAGGTCTATLPTTSCSLTSTSAGNKTVTITYNGDANFNTSSNTAGHAVNKADTTTTITADNPDPSVVGQSVTVNYTVAANSPGSGTPTGNVIVTVSGGAETCTGTVAGGFCSLPLTTLGNRTITATYQGDTNYNGSTSAGAPHTVNKADTTTTIVSDNPDSSSVGQNVTAVFTVVATAPGSGTPTGNVTVSDGVNSCTGTVAAGSCVLALTTPGARTLTATYASDTNFNGSSDTASHTVVAPPVIAKAFAPNTISVNGTTTLTFTITNPAANTVALTGVSFTDTFPNNPNLVVATPLTTTNTCGGTLTNDASGVLAANNTGIKLSGGTIGIGGSCTVSVNVTPKAQGPFNNVSGNVTSTNGGTGNTAADTLSTNNPPTIIVSPVLRTEGAASANATVAMVNDVEDAKNTLSLKVNGGTSATVTGVTLSNLAVNAAGVVTADVASPCGAMTAIFTVRVTDSGGLFAEALLRVTVTPQPTPALRINDVTLAEGSPSGTTAFTFTVALTPAHLCQTVTVNYATANGSATAGSDYTATSNTLSFAPGETVKTITVNVGKDKEVEPDETFFVNLSNPVNATLADGQGLGTITNDDFPPFTATMGDPFVCSGVGSSLLVTATLTNPNSTPQAATFNVTLPSQLTIIPNTCTANVGTCTTTPPNQVAWMGNLGAGQTVTIQYQAQVADGTPLGTLITINSTGSVNGVPTATSASGTVSCPNNGPNSPVVNDQKPGSLLVFPYYKHDAQNKVDTRLTLTNIGKLPINVHFLFLDGATCQEFDQFVCFTPNASIQRKASEFDPQNKGYLIAYVTDNQGQPLAYNGLIGNAFVTDGEYVGNYGAESFASPQAQGTTIGAVSTPGLSWTIPLDGIALDMAPTAFAVELQSPVDTINQKLVLAGLRGDAYAGTLGGVTQIGAGLVYNGHEALRSFSPFISGQCLVEKIIDSTTPRVAGTMASLMPKGEVGTLRFSVTAATGLLLTSNKNALSGIRTLHKVQVGVSSLIVPLLTPDCQYWRPQP